MSITTILIVLVVILVSMTLHEFMHGFIAYKLGDDTPRLMGRLSLNPVKHIDPFLTLALPLLLIVTNSLTGAGMPIFGGAKPVPFQSNNIRYGEWGIALMAIAGPLTNFFLAFIGYGVAVALGLVAYGGAFFATIPGTFMATFVMVNLGFFAFNILPIPPLDGSRVLYSIAPDPVRRFLEIVERQGLIIVFILVMFAGSLLMGYMSAVMGWSIDLFAFLFGK